MAEPVRARRLTDQEGQRLQQIVRRGKHGSIRVRRAMIIMASGTPVLAIARLVAADKDTVRDVVHAFNEKGLAALDPQWAGGRPRLISDDDTEFIVTAATTRPEKLGLPFTHWSLRKLAAYLARNPARIVKIGRERLRQILHGRQISFQRTRTWKESADPDKDAKLDRIEHVTSRFSDRCAFVLDGGRPVAEVARNIGVHEMTLGRWVKVARDAAESGKNPDAPLGESERAELARLRAESRDDKSTIAELRMQVEFAKK
jgi:transposase/transposase-like protein